MDHLNEKCSALNFEYTMKVITMRWALLVTRRRGRRELEDHGPFCLGTVFGFEIFYVHGAVK